MPKNQKTKYAPNLRNHLDAPLNNTKSFSEKDFIELPDNVTDPIVANNISTSEFDYTFNNGDDVLPADDDEYF